MAVSYASGGIHFTGLGSDTDFDNMITELKKLESHQKNRFTLWQADWNRRIDAFQELNTAMLSLNSSLNSMNTMEKFLIKTATTSKTDIMTATASGKAQNSTNKVEVNNPPIKVTAIGRKKSPPYSARGINPKIVVALVSKIGLILLFTAMIQLVKISSPSSDFSESTSRAICCKLSKSGRDFSSPI